jgi:hypothetical protein
MLYENRPIASGKKPVCHGFQRRFGHDSAQQTATLDLTTY